MKCPICNIELNMTERQGVEIDYCPQCRGVWLDRGELDKIIEKSQANSLSAAYSAQSKAADHVVNPGNQYQPQYKEQYYQQGKYSNYKKHKKEGFLEDLFDF